MWLAVVIIITYLAAIGVMTTGDYEVIIVSLDKQN